MKAWYLLYSKVRRETVALENLVRQNCRVYLPMLRASRLQLATRAKSVQPMFPRYLFVHLTDYVIAGYDVVFASHSGEERVMLCLVVAGTQARLQGSNNQLEPASSRWSPQ